MATKKTNSQPKVTTPKAIKEKKVKSTVELVEFSVMATIPTMMYGNIMPRITVKAKTMEEAKSAIFPVLEDLYESYCEEPRDGRKPKFMTKANVTAEEKIVKVPPPTGPTMPVAPKAADNATGPAAPAPKTPSIDDEIPAKSAAFLKAENAIKNSLSKDATIVIEDQIQKSVKLSAEEKPALLEMVLKKRKELNG